MKAKKTTESKPRPGRPVMPKGYGIKDPKSGSGLIAWESASQKIAAARNYWVGTTRPDGHPHIMPVWGLWLEGAFLFSTSRASRKGRNLAQQPYLVVHLESGDDVIILEGLAQEADDPGLLAKFADAYEAKYNFRPGTDDPGSPIYALYPQVAFAWLESDFIGGATRWQF